MGFQVQIYVLQVLDYDVREGNRILLIEDFDSLS
jgi:hypothetical protein